MNFKKFISGVSAFAIAASAFAGLAVTASANYTVADDGTKTWDFADYAADNTNYDIFVLGGSATISTSGIQFKDTYSGDSIESHYVAFTPTENGYITLTMKANAAYAYGYVYTALDAESESLKIGAFDATETSNSAYYVRKDQTYYITGKSSADNKKRDVTITNVVFKPANRPVPSYTAATTLELDNENLFAVNGSVTPSASAISFGRENTGITSGYVAFKAPQNGTIDVTFIGSEKQTRSYSCYIYADDAGTTTLDSGYNVSKDTEKVLSTSVTAGSTYYIVGVKCGSACASKITSAVFTPSFAVTADTETVNGTVEADNTSALVGAIVTVTATPAKYYQLKNYVVTGTTSGATYNVTNNTFTMPGEAVTVSAEFEAIEYADGDVKSVTTVDDITITGDSIADADGIDVSASSESSTATAEIEIDPISVDGKAVSFKATVGNNTKHTGSFTIYSDAEMENKWTNFYIQGNGSTVQVKNYSNNSGYKVGASSEVEITLIQSSSSSALSIFVNGKAYISDNTERFVNAGTKQIAGIKISGRTFSINDFKVIENPGTAKLNVAATSSVEASNITYIVGTEVTLPDADEGKVWSADGTTAVESNTITVPVGGATYTQIAAPSTPTDGAEVTAVSYNQYDAAYTGDKAVTAAKVLVTVTGSITKLGLKYNYSGDNWTDAQYANDTTTLTTAGGSILLGAILPGLHAPTTASFQAVID